MALEHILAALEKAFEAEIAELQTQATAEVQQILTDSEAQARAVRLNQLEAIRPRIQAERSRRVNKARLDAQRTNLEMRRDLIAAVFDVAKDQLGQIRQRPDFHLILAALVREVLDELGDTARLEIDRRDFRLVQHCLHAVDDRIAVDTTIQTWGGVIGHSPDGRITVDNTLEVRFSNVQELCWGDVAGLLEGEESDVG